MFKKTALFLMDGFPYLDIIIIICFSVSTFGQVFGLLEAGGQSKLAAEDHSAHSESMEKCNCDQDIGDEEVDVNEQNHDHDSDVDIKRSCLFPLFLYRGKVISLGKDQDRYPLLFLHCHPVQICP